MSKIEIISIDISSDSEPESENIDKQESLQNKEKIKRVVPSKKDESQSSSSVSSKRLNNALKNLSIQDEFMGKFDPENSNREKRKLSKKINNDSVKMGHDDSGMLMPNGMDLCDCLDEKCAGCFFPCRYCRSCKCGVDCRNNRKWIIDCIESEADSTKIRNPWLIQQEKNGQN